MRETLALACIDLLFPTRDWEKLSSNVRLGWFDWANLEIIYGCKELREFPKRTSFEFFFISATRFYYLRLVKCLHDNQ